MKTFILNNFARLINHYLQLDQHSKKRLEKLQGRIITIELMPLHFIFQILFSEEGITMKEGGECAAETIVRGTPLQMMNLLFAHDKRKQFIDSDLEITGNADFAQQVVNLLDEIEIDWEEQLAKITGDSVSHHVGRFASRVKNWYRKTTDDVKADLRDYLHEEKLWAPSQEAVTEFYHEIDHLRMDVDRLEARFNQLAAQLNALDDTHEDEEIS